MSPLLFVAGPQLRVAYRNPGMAEVPHVEEHGLGASHAQHHAAQCLPSAEAVADQKVDALARV